MAYTAVNLGVANTLIKNVMQVAHGFSVGEIVGFNGTVWFLAKADNFADGLAIGLVTAVQDVNDFTVTVAGYVNSLSGLTAGDLYYLSPTVAGGVQTTMPSVVGQIVRPVYIAISTTEAFVMYWVGDVVTNTTPTGFTWNVVTTNTPMVKDNGYITTSGTITLSLPTSAAVGDIVQVAGSTGTGWIVTQAAGQSIQFGIDTTTVGVTGGLASLTATDGVELVCIVANTTFLVISSIGTITIN